MVKPSLLASKCFVNGVTSSCALGVFVATFLACAHAAPLSGVRVERGRRFRGVSCVGIGRSGRCRSRLGSRGCCISIGFRTCKCNCTSIRCSVRLDLLLRSPAAFIVIRSRSRIRIRRCCTHNISWTTLGTSTAAKTTTVPALTTMHSHGDR